MKTAILAAGALAVATLSGATGATAKNVNFSLTLGGPGAVLQVSGPGQNSHAYRNRGNGAHQGFNPYVQGHAPQYRGKPGLGYGYGAPRRPAYQPHRPQVRHCMAQQDIRWMLSRQGWQGFHFDKLTSDIAVVYSHRNGQRYRIKIDRCNHAIIKVSAKSGLF